MDFSNSNWLEDFNKLMDADMAKSDALGDGVIVGKIFSLPVADGSAYYKVVKVNKRTARVEWLKELSLDDYQDRMLGDKGTVQISKIEPMLAYDKKLREIIKNNN